MGNRRVILSIAVGALVLPLLAACHPEAPAPDVTAVAPKPTVSATPTATPTPTPEPAVFVAPTSCEQMLGAALVAQITSGKTELFSSSDGTGLYYPHDPKQQGGFQCQYGINNVDYSTFELDAQALTQKSHEDVITILDATGMAKTVDGDVVTYTQVGDEGSTQLYLHVVRPDSWITGWASLGGQKQLGVISGYVAAVGQQLYPAP